MRHAIAMGTAQLHVFRELDMSAMQVQQARRARDELAETVQEEETWVSALTTKNMTVFPRGTWTLVAAGSLTSQRQQIDV